MKKGRRFPAVSCGTAGDFLRPEKMTKKVVKKVLTNKVVNGILMMTRKVVKMKRIIVIQARRGAYGT